MLLVFLAVTGIAPAALACDPVPEPTEYLARPALAAEDTTPPSTPEIGEAILRQRRPELLETQSRCGSLSSFQIVFAPSSTDDRTAPENIGYELEVVDGEPPSALHLPTTPVRFQYDWAVADRFVFGFGESNEDVRFSLRVSAIDEAGNRSSASALVLVTGEAGCSLAGQAGLAGSLPTAAPLFGLLLLRLGRRRRPR